MKTLFILLIFCSNCCLAAEKISSHEREKVYQAISRIDVLIDFYQDDVKKFTKEESSDKLREYLLSLAAMKVKMKLMLRMPFGMTSNLKDLQEMKSSLSQKSLDDLVKMIEAGSI